jgi:hypothetical protein
MRRSLLSTAAIFVLLSSMLFIPARVSARSRCPVKMPETLLSLYRNSDAIYIAAFDKTVDGEITEDTAEYSTINVKMHFSISSTLKGESRKFFVREDEEYRYKNAEPQGEAEAEAEESEEIDDDYGNPGLQPGDTLLLFLKNGEEGEGLRLTDYRDGIKKLSREQISVYEARIRDLASIFSDKKISEAKIVDWLVRCAVDPATRWEGTFELLQSFQEMEWREEAAKERKEQIAKGEAVEEIAEVKSEALNGDDDGKGPAADLDTAGFAKILSDSQKETLANILLESPVARADESREAAKKIRGDHELIELVQKWGDPRLVGFLLEGLRAGSNDPVAAGRAMTKIAEILDDKDAASIAEKYSEDVYEDDEDLVGDDSEEADAQADDPAANAPDENKDAEDVPSAESDPKETPAADSKEGPAKTEPKKLTYKELRSDLMQKFLDRCDQAIAEKEAEKEAVNSAKSEH